MFTFLFKKCPLLHELIHVYFITFILNLIVLTELPSPYKFNSPLLISGVLGSKGKERATDPEEEPSKESSKDIEAEEEDSYDKYLQEIARAKWESAKQFKYGESSKDGAKLGESNIDRDIDRVKSLTAESTVSAAEFNTLKMQLDKQGAREDIKEDILSPFMERHLSIIEEIATIKKDLSSKGIDLKDSPKIYEWSDHSSDYSGYESDSEESRKDKRVKYSNNDGEPFFVLPITVNLPFFAIPIFNILFVVISGLILYLIELGIIYNITLPFSITLTQLVTLYIYINFIMLIHRYYTNFFKLYNNYLNKNYLSLYSNIYFTTILLMFYFSTNIDTGIFYC